MLELAITIVTTTRMPGWYVQVSTESHIHIVAYYIQHMYDTERAPYNCTNGEIRLAGAGASAWRGRVEICINDFFGTVCDDGWDDLDAAVVCRQLGYPLAGMLVS